MNKQVERLQTELAKINFTLRDCGCDHYTIVNDKHEILPFHVLNNDLSVNYTNGYNYTVHFSLDKCEYSELQTDGKTDTICIGTKDIFINLYMKEKD